MNDEWVGKNVLILGLGDSGLSALRFLGRRGARLRAADSRRSPPALEALRREHPGLAPALGPFDALLLEGVDAVVASPGIALREPLLREAAARGIEILGDVEIFARELAHRTRDPARSPGGARVIGITGTNGKSTVTALAAAMGEAAGWKSVACGNIGLPVLDALDAPGADGTEFFAVELSSYQLETTASLALDAAAMLNVSQDHMDRYDSMADYARAKARIFDHAEVRVVNRDDAASRAMAAGDTFSFGLGVPDSRAEWGLDAARRHLRRGSENFLDLDGMKLQGLHNAANALAAHALLTAVDAPAAVLSRAIRDFGGLRHRVEVVAECAGVRFIDDSKGTNVGATLAALEGSTQPVVLIAGGDGKGQDFSSLAPAVRAHARAVVLIGRDAQALAAVLGPTGIPLDNAATMEDAVARAFACARPGDAVLLSPACASLDMFRNYGHRGDVFAAAARALAGKAA